MKIWFQNRRAKERKVNKKKGSSDDKVSGDTDSRSSPASSIEAADLLHTTGTTHNHDVTSHNHDVASHNHDVTSHNLDITSSAITAASLHL